MLPEIAPDSAPVKPPALAPCTTKPRKSATDPETEDRAPASIDSVMLFRDVARIVESIEAKRPRKASEAINPAGLSEPRLIASPVASRSEERASI